MEFRSKFCEDIFHVKNYSKPELGINTWADLARQITKEVCHGLIPLSLEKEICLAITNQEFIPGGRYLYFAGRESKYYNNCYLLSALEDTREDWANLSWKNQSCLMTGGGVGIVYDAYRPKGRKLKRIGGFSSGPVAAMHVQNEIGRVIRQGGTSRTALWAGLSWNHGDIKEFLIAKDWSKKIAGSDLTLAEIKGRDFSYPAPLDMTNISVMYDDDFLNEIGNPDQENGSWNKNTLAYEVFLANVLQAMKSGEPGFAFNFGFNCLEKLSNACTEVKSGDDSDVCNIGSVNLSRIHFLTRFQEVIELAIVFLLCGSIRGHVPYEKVAQVRERNRRIGLGLLGIHEWLLLRGKKYKVDRELTEWLSCYDNISHYDSSYYSGKLNLNMPKGVRAIAPNGSISLISGTTSGIEPLYALAYKRRYLDSKSANYKYQYNIDFVAKYLIEEKGILPENIETANDLAKDFERRIEFQDEVEKHVDMGCSSTINLPEWGSEFNNESLVEKFAITILKYARRGNIRGLTFYPDGSRGGQPLVPVPYEEAKNKLGVEFVESSNDICSIANKGSCGG